MDLAKLMVDPDKCEAGITRHPWGDDHWVKVRANDCNAAQVRRQALILAARAEVPDEAEELPEDVVRRIQDRLLADVLVVDWNLELNGTPLPCTPETVFRLMQDPRCRRIRQAILLATLDTDGYRIEADSVAVGNFVTPSGGTSATASSSAASASEPPEGSE